MTFASTSFLFLFFPLCIGLYFLTPKKYRNHSIFLFSILFYLCNDPTFFPYFMIMIAISYACMKIDRSKSHLLITLSFLLFLMAYFKYYRILLDTLHIGNPKLILNPLGYSFILFSMISVVVDVYRHPDLSLTFYSYMNYILFFPKIFMGPLMRYPDFIQQWNHHPTCSNDLYKGSIQFVKGCFLKVVLANTFASIISLCTSSSLLATWMILIAYAFQLYFDFYGYSCMAQGIGLFFGFHLPDNFHHPYLAISMQDFWNRWHISLSTWFKDYVYIPLGGNRHGQKKTIHNLFIVWFLTGIWHGSSLPYIGWGLYHGCLLLLERYVFKKWLSKLPKMFQQTKTFLLASIGWIAFFQPTLQDCIQFFLQLFNIQHFYDLSSLSILSQYFTFFLFGFLCMGNWGHKLYTWLQKQCGSFFIWLELLGFISLWMIIFSFMIGDSYQSFLYFQF